MWMDSPGVGEGGSEHRVMGLRSTVWGKGSGALRQERRLQGQREQRYISP